MNEADRSLPGLIRRDLSRNRYEHAHNVCFHYFIISFCGHHLPPAFCAPLKVFGTAYQDRRKMRKFTEASVARAVWAVGAKRHCAPLFSGFKIGNAPRLRAASRAHDMRHAEAATFPVSMCE